MRLNYRKLSKLLDTPEDFRHLVKISDECCAIYTVPFTSNPLAIAMLSNVLMDTGTAVVLADIKEVEKASKFRHEVCVCDLKPSEDVGKSASSSQSCSSVITSPSSTDAPGIETAVDVPMTVCRKSSLKLAILRTIPHPVPPEILQACR